MKIHITPLVLVGICMSCSQNTYTVNVIHNPGSCEDVNLIVNVNPTLDHTQFLLVNNTNDSLAIPRAGANWSRFYFLLGTEQRELEYFTSISYYKMMMIAPGEMYSWDEDLAGLIEYLEIDTSDKISMYWKFYDFRSDTVKLK